MLMTYTVFSMVQETIQRTVTLQNGQEVQAGVAGLVVELVEPQGDNTVTLRFVPADIEAAKAMFAVGNTITATLAQE